MATFRERESGWWQAIVRRRGYPVESKTFPRKIDAEAWARDIENQIDRGIFVSRAEAENTTLADALDRYRKEITAKKRSKATEEYRVKYWTASSLAPRMLATIRRADVAAWRDRRLAEGVKPATARLELALLSHVFTICQKEWGIEVDNPVSKIRMPAVDNARNRRLVGDEEARLLAAIDEPGYSVLAEKGDRRNIWMPALVRVALETAMRQGELLSLRWSNVDLVNRVAHLLITKNGNPRDVPLSKAAIKALKGLPRTLKGKVFGTTASAVKQSYARAVARARREYMKECEAAGIEPKPGFLEDLTFHDLRHEATSRLAEKLAMHELMKVTGHKDARMLARYYHPRAADLAKKLG